jgi:hypothetical protein
MHQNKQDKWAGQKRIAIIGSGAITLTGIFLYVFLGEEILEEYFPFVLFGFCFLFIIIVAISNKRYPYKRPPLTKEQQKQQLAEFKKFEKFFPFNNIEKVPIFIIFATIFTIASFAIAMHYLP